MPNIFEFSDYRAYLREYFRERKAASPSFSHQNFARKAQIRSSGFLLHVMKGERNLTKPVILKVARAIGLSAGETEYFEDLVSFDQAKNQTDKSFYFSKVSEKRQNARIKNIDDAQYEFFREWYHSAIRELITLILPNNDAARIAKTLVPPISPAQAKKSLKLLLQSGLVRKNKAGNFEQSEPFIAAGGPVRNVAIVNFQKAMLAIAAQAWDLFPEKEVHMHTMTLTMSDELVATIEKEILQFKKKVLSLVASEKNGPTRVHHLNLNFFPLSKKIKEA
jgi:uncharacterized protein (TIGR02147 family)